MSVCSQSIVAAAAVLLLLVSVLVLVSVCSQWVAQILVVCPKEFPRNTLGRLPALAVWLELIHSTFAVAVMCWVLWTVENLAQLAVQHQKVQEGSKAHRAGPHVQHQKFAGM